MYGGQGKNTNNFNLTPVNAKMNDEISAIKVANMKNTNEGLDQPRLDKTNAEVLGDDKQELRTQNKKRKQQLRAAQVPQSQWTTHTGQVATIQHLCLEHPEHIGTLFAQRVGHSITPQPTLCTNGPHSGAQHEQGATGQKKKCGRR